MKTKISTYAVPSAIMTACLVLVGCGGGSDTPADTPASLTLSGTAATGLAMSGAAVSAKCASGSQSGKAETSGAYTLRLEGGSLPCVLQASSDKITLYSVATGSGDEAVANITPVTHAVVAKALGDEATVASVFAQANVEKIKVAANGLSSALATVRSALTGVADFSQDPFTTPFTAQHTGSNGDDFDVQLYKLNEKLVAANSTLSQLVHAIATSQGSASAPTPGVLGVLTPPANTSCPMVRSGQYVVLNERGQLDEPGTYDAAKNTWTDKKGSFSFAVEVQSDNDCRMVIKNGQTEVMHAQFNSQGLGLWRSVEGFGTDFGLVIPYQAHALSDLAGNWNAVGYDRENTTSNPMFGFGKAEIKTDGSWTQNRCPTSNGAQACEGFKAQATPFTVDSGKFSNGDGHGYLYKAPNGTKMYVQSFGDEKGFAILAQPYVMGLPTVGQTSTFWDVWGNFSSVNPLEARSGLVQSVDAVANSYTRADGQVRLINKPAEGMSYRAQTADRGATIYLHAKDLITVYGRENSGNFVGFSISK
jgi:hypothetical protein